MPSRRKFVAGSITVATATAGCSDLADELDTDNGQNEGSDEFEEGSPLDDPETRRELVDEYDAAIGSTNNGLEARDAGIQAQNDEDFSTAISEFETAEAAFGAAAEQFADALALAFQIEHDGAENACENGNEYGRTMESAMAIAATSAEAADMGVIGEANEMLDDAREMENDADQLDVPDTGEVADMLDVEPEGGF